MTDSMTIVKLLGRDAQTFKYIERPSPHNSHPICAVLQGRADPSLLGSYQHERKPVALANTALSVSNWQQALKVPAALGLDSRAANLLQAAVASRPASLLPPGASLLLKTDSSPLGSLHRNAGICRIADALQTKRQMWHSHQ